MRKRWSAAGMRAPNSLMIAASSSASSFSVRQNGDSTARAASASPSATCARARMITPSDVCGSRLAEGRDDGLRVAGSRGRARARCCGAALRRPASAAATAPPSAISPLGTAGRRSWRSPRPGCGGRAGHRRAPSRTAARRVDIAGGQRVEPALQRGDVAARRRHGGSSRSGCRSAASPMSASIVSDAAADCDRRLRRHLGPVGAPAGRAPAPAPAQCRGRRPADNAACPWA